MNLPPKIRIIGAGMAGLLAATMLRRYRPVVYERQSSLPNNHHALLRFPTTAVSLATGIPFQRVLAHKGIWDGEKVVNAPTIPLVNSYSRNALRGAIENRSIWRMQPVEERWLAPRDFIQQLADGAEIEYESMDALVGCKGAIATNYISTVPLPTLLKLREFEGMSPDGVSFDSIPIYVQTADLDISPDVCQTIYNAGPDFSWYRATVQNSQAIVESTNVGSFLTDILDHIFSIGSGRIKGLPKSHTQQFGKIRCSDNEARRALIFHLTQRFNLYSLGRFATWRQILLDDVIQDIRRIEAMIHSSPYHHQLQASKIQK
jgi:hypothetical protein